MGVAVRDRSQAKQGRCWIETRAEEVAMRYMELEHLSNAEFKRLCGVSRATFAKMVEVVRPSLERRGQRGGQAKLSAEDQ